MSVIYCSVEDVKKVIPERILIQLLDDDRKGLTLEELASSLEEIIKDAEGTIDTYLKGRYTIPLPNSVPSLINRIAIRLVRYMLYERRGAEIPEAVKSGYKEAIRQLEDLRDGDLEIDAPKPTSNFFIKSNKTKESSIFSNPNSSLNLDNYM